MVMLKRNVIEQKLHFPKPFSHADLRKADLSGVPSRSLACLLSLCSDYLRLSNLTSEQWTQACK